MEAAAAFPCASKATGLHELQAEILHRDGAEIQLSWTFRDSLELWSTEIPELPALRSYRRWLREQGGSENPSSMFEVHRSLAPRQPELPALQHRINRAVENGKLGLLRPMNCLESHLLSFLAERSEIEAMRELSAYVLTHPERKEVRVYFLAGKGVFPPRDHLVKPRITEDQSAGWVLAQHIHNHTVVFEEGERLFFPLAAPSTSDAQYAAAWAEAHLQRFIVLDGFSAGEIELESLLRFLEE